MSHETRRGGLGRGLAALIPSGTEKPWLSESAADHILGGTDKQGRGAKDDDAPDGANRRGHERLNDIIAHAGARDPRDPRESRTEASESDFPGRYAELAVGDIVPNPLQPRRVFDDEALDELAHSIKEFGLLQPIVVRRAAADIDAAFEIVMGERRWRAAARAGLPTIPAIIRSDADDSTVMLRDALLENIHRVQLNPLEEGAAYQQLLEEFDVTQEELAARLGRSRPTITNTIRLLSLPVPVQKKVAAGVLTAGHARALMGLKTGEEAQVALAERIVAEGLSVRATEEAVTLANRGDEPKAPRRRAAVKQPEYLTRSAERLADKFDTKVTVTMGRRKGRMVVEFGDQDDFVRIMDLIDPGHGLLGEEA